MSRVFLEDRSMESLSREERTLLDRSLRLSEGGRGLRKNSLSLWIVMCSGATLILLPDLKGFASGQIGAVDFGKTAGFLLVLFAAFYVSRKLRVFDQTARSTIAKILQASHCQRCGASRVMEKCSSCGLESEEDVFSLEPPGGTGDSPGIPDGVPASPKPEA